MGSTGNPPVPVGDPPNETSLAARAKGQPRSQAMPGPFRPAGRRTAQASVGARLCEPQHLRMFQRVPSFPAPAGVGMLLRVSDPRSGI